MEDDWMDGSPETKEPLVAKGHVGVRPRPSLGAVAVRYGRPRLSDGDYSIYCDVGRDSFMGGVQGADETTKELLSLNLDHSFEFRCQAGETCRWRQRKPNWQGYRAAAREYIIRWVLKNFGIVTILFAPKTNRAVGSNVDDEESIWISRIHLRPPLYQAGLDRRAQCERRTRRTSGDASWLIC